MKKTKEKKEVKKKKTRSFFAKKKSSQIKKEKKIPTQKKKKSEKKIDSNRRTFIKTLGILGLTAFGASLFPKKADALVMGGTPATGVVGLKNASNTRVNPATEETLQEIVTGTATQKKTIVLTTSDVVHTPTSGKKIRLYNTKFSLSANMESVSFRFTSGGNDFEKYLSPRTGGLYGVKNHPNYIEGGTNEALYCSISGTGTVQINIDYLEV